MEQAIVNWEAISAVSEAFGVIAIVISLVFVGFQIRQNVQATRAASMDNIMEKWGEFYLRLSENDNLAAVVWNGVQDAKALVGVDRWRLFHGFNQFLLFLEQCLLSMDDRSIRFEGMVCTDEIHDQFAVTTGGTRGMGRKERYATGGLSNVRRNRNPH